MLTAVVGGGLPQFVCLSVFSQGILKTDAAKITKPAIEMFYNESWKPIYILLSKGHEAQTLPALVFALL